MDGWVDGQMDRQMYVLTYGQTDIRMVRWTDGWMDGWVDQHMDTWTDKRMDRRTD